MTLEYFFVPSLRIPLSVLASKPGSISPYFTSETRMTVGKDLGVIALRNDERVWDRELFLRFVYKDKAAEIVKNPLRCY
ncbi:MAG: hypothetical protein AABZ61_01265 [Bacteroidota bacterium]